MNRHLMHAVGHDEVARFAADGAICIRNVLDVEWVGRMNQAIDRLLAHPGNRAREATKAGGTGRFHMNVFMWRWDPDFRALALESPLAELAASLMSQDRVSLFYDQAFVKEPGTQEVTQWHHDLPFWPARGQDIVSLWVALTHVTVEGSGVEYVAGSHRWGRFFRAVTPDEDPNFTDGGLEPCPDFSAMKGDPRYRFLSWECAPGDVICHHPLTVHGASGNLLKSRRAAVSIRYAGSDAHWDPRPNVMRVEGAPEQHLKAGDPLELDGVFPVAWQRDHAPA
ncbi:MAG TPA: phytanoyl-CoA dioxygenase family protein [Stellaceae bacterium]